MDDQIVASILPLRVQRLCYSVGGVQAIRNVSFEIVAGSRNIILGANGAGKSVLLRLLHGLLPPSSGEIIWNKNNAAAHQAMVFQRPVMLRRTVIDNIIFALNLNNRHLDIKSVAKEASAALASVGLAHLTDRAARHCSGGEQQRIALARAWALKPEVLFLDEPTASLDPTATKAIEEIMADISRAGTTIIMTTHDIGQAKRLADRILFLHDGRLVEDAPSHRFFDKPESPPAAAFIKGELLW